jgi:hypothetical protein
MVFVSNSSSLLNVIPGRTVLHYRNDILINTHTYPTEREAQRHAADHNVIESHCPMAATHHYEVAQ